MSLYQAGETQTELESLLEAVSIAFSPACARAPEVCDGLLWEAIGEATALLNGNDRRGRPIRDEAYRVERLRLVLERLRGVPVL